MAYGDTVAAIYYLVKEEIRRHAVYHDNEAQQGLGRSRLRRLIESGGLCESEFKEDRLRAR